MKFRLIALASCVALGSIAFGGKAQAQFTTATDVTLTSTGTVGLNCQVTTPPTAGVMVLDTADVLSSAAGTGALLASFGLTCSQTAAVVVGTSTTTGVTAIPTGATIVADLLDGTSVGSSTTTVGGATVSSTSTVLAATPAAAKTLTMSHIITTAAAAPLPAGNYAVATIVTITPQ